MRQRQLEFSAASASSQGARQYQEDSTQLWFPEGSGTNGGERRAVLAVLADGMGGHVSGEVASKLACEECVQHFSTMRGELQEKIATAPSASNASLERAIQSDSRLSGMGCTLVAAYLDREGVRWASVGDSALLLFRNDQLYRLNENHSLGALLDKQADAKLITHEEARNSPNRQSLRSALTGGPIALTDIGHSPQRVQRGDWVIVSSDGLDTLTGDDIATVIGRCRDGTPADLTRKLLDEVGQRAVPNQDNTSIIAVRVQGAENDVTRQPGSPRGAGNGAGASDSDDVPDTVVMGPVIRGTLVGRVRRESPAAPTVLIRQPSRSRRFGVGGVAFAVALLVVAAAAVWWLGPWTTSSTEPTSNTESTKSSEPPNTKGPPNAKGPQNAKGPPNTKGPANSSWSTEVQNDQPQDQETKKSSGERQRATGDQ